MTDRPTERDHADSPMPSLDGLQTWREASTSASGDRRRPRRAPVRPSATSPTLFANADRVVLTGAGSSYYLAQVTATVAREMTGRFVVAAPLSELILRPTGVLGTGLTGREPVIVISRSGSTSEAVDVAEQVRRSGHLTIAVTCRANSPLAARAHRVLVSSAGDEQAIVMTRSFASMLALLLRLVAGVAPDPSLADDLDRMPERWPEAVAAADVGHRLGSVNHDRIVVLGGGPARGIADGVVPEADRDQPGPGECVRAARVPPRTDLAVRTGRPRRRPDRRSRRERTRHACCARPAGSARRPGWSTSEAAEDRAVAGWISLVGRDLHPWARLPLLLYPAQALALSLALVRGRDPDAPRHLGQVVILDPA